MTALLHRFNRAATLRRLARIERELDRLNAKNSKKGTKPS